MESQYTWSLINLNLRSRARARPDLKGTAKKLGEDLFFPLTMTLTLWPYDFQKKNRFIIGRFDTHANTSYYSPFASGIDNRIENAHAVLISDDSKPDFESGVGNGDEHVPEVVLGELERWQVRVHVVITYGDAARRTRSGLRLSFINTSSVQCVSIVCLSLRAPSKCIQKQWIKPK